MAEADDPDYWGNLRRQQQQREHAQRMFLFDWDAAMEAIFNAPPPQPRPIVVSRSARWWMLRYYRAKTVWDRLKLGWLQRWSREGFDVTLLIPLDTPLTWRAFLPPSGHEHSYERNPQGFATHCYRCSAEWRADAARFAAAVGW